MTVQTPAVPGYMPAPAPLRPPLTDREISRMQFRVALLQRRGFQELHAERWADVLQHRDTDRDDRRLCAECRHVTRSWGCRRGGTVVVDLLQRCHRFQLETPS